MNQFEKRVREEWPEVADQILGVIRDTINPWDIDPSIEPWIEAEGIYPARPRANQRDCDRLQAINKLIEGHGCEAIFDDGQMWPDMEYVNVGDSYAATIVLDRVEGRWLVTSWGDWVEHAERNGRAYN